MERRAGVTMVEGDARLADYVLCEAFRRTPAEKRAPVGNFLDAAHGNRWRAAAH